MTDYFKAPRLFRPAFVFIKSNKAIFNATAHITMLLQSAVIWNWHFQVSSCHAYGIRNSVVATGLLTRIRNIIFLMVSQSNFMRTWYITKIFNDIEIPSDILSSFSRYLYVQRHQNAIEPAVSTPACNRDALSVFEAMLLSRYPQVVVYWNKTRSLEWLFCEGSVKVSNKLNQ